MRAPLAITAAALVIASSSAIAGPPDRPVIGGHDAKAGRWPDVAAVLVDGQQSCTGTLVAPTVVLTAGHCDELPPTHVLIGAASLDNVAQGEVIRIERRIEFPDWENSEDLMLLVLERASKKPPRKLATGWARLDIVNGAKVAIVGYGAVDPNAEEYVDELQEAATTITDAECLAKPGCIAAVAPGGELGAGGMGIDTCPGDSGGPLYLTTSYGDLLAGVTSRSYDDAITACKDGGIYARPDKVVEQLEQLAGVRLARGPEPRFEALEVAAPGGGADMRIEPNDPRSDTHTLEITVPPAHGAANLRRDGAVRVCTDPAAGAGTDALVVTITDVNDPARKLSVTVPITIGDGAPAAEACDLEAFSFPEDDGGCCDSGRGRGAGGAAALALLVLIIAGRRRRRAHDRRLPS